MGANIPLPALDIRPPQQQTDPTENLLRLKSLLGQQQLQQGQSQLQQQQIQQGQMQLKQTQALNNSYKNALTTDANGNPSFDRQKVIQSVAAAGQGSLIPKLNESFMQLDKLGGEVQEAKDKHNAAAQEYFATGAKMIQSANYDPAVAGTFLAHAAANGYAKEATQFQQQLAQDPSKIKPLVDSIISSSPKQAEASKNQAQASADSARQQLDQQQLQQQQRIAAGTSPTGITAQQQTEDALRKQQIAGEAAGRAETKRHNLASEGTLTPDALKIAADQFAATGQMPNVGRGGAVRSQIINQAALDHPKVDLATNSAAFRANEASLKNVTGTLDTLSAFENTGLKNLKQFTDLAAKIPDTGVPWLNTPVRLLNERMMGSPDQSAALAAGQVALREIARVTNDPKLSGSLTDSARGEVMGLIPNNATLPQIKRVAGILQQDMANVHGSLADQQQAIKQRLSNSASGGNASPSAPAAQTATGPNGHKIVVKDNKWVDAQTGAPVQ